MLLRLGLLFACASTWVGCTQRNPAFCTADQDCASGRCDVRINTCMPPPGVDGMGPPPDGSSGVDAPMATSIPHVPPGHDGVGTGDLNLDFTIIDTGNLSIGTQQLPAGVTFDTSPQMCPNNMPVCPELAVLHANNVIISGN